MTGVSAIKNSREMTRFFKFAIVGIIGAVVDFGVANLLRRGLGTSLGLAGTVSFICAILSNFVWNRYWTYPDSRSKPIFRQLIQFSVISVAGLVIRIPILTFLEPVLSQFFNGLAFDLPVFDSGFYADNFTLAIAVLIVMFWNFFVNRYWTYNDVD